MSLTEKQAAQLLGWSPANLKKAIHKGVKLPNSGRKIKVPATHDSRGTRIAESDLESFILEFENEEPGRHPPVSVRRTLLVESGHQCGICKADAPLQFHHILEWSRLHHHDPEHMLAVCGNCHSKINGGQIDLRAQEQYKQNLKIRSNKVITLARIESLPERRKARLGPLLSPGDRVASGPFQIVEHIGAGGFATVWKALDEESNEVALKILHQQWLYDQTRKDRFARGAKQMARLQHPNIVKVLSGAQLDSEFQIYYFAMEFCDGQNLHDFVLNNGLANQKAITQILISISSALAHAHSKGVVHRDIKPRNVIVCADVDAKLIDFDLVRAFDTTGGTRTGALGSVFYAAPECWNSAKEATAASDIYSLGMTALFAFLGRDISMQDFRAPEQCVRSLSIPSSVKRVLVKCLQESADLRPSASIVKDVLVSSLNDPVVDLADDPPDWINHSKFNAGCREKYSTDYASVRESLRWNIVEKAIDELSLRLSAVSLQALFDNSRPFNSDKPLGALVKVAIAEDPELDLTSNEQSVVDWLTQRRLVLAASNVSRHLHQGERKSLEAVLICFWNLIPPEERTKNLISEQSYMKKAVTLRPTLSNIGLKMGEMAKGTSSVSTLGVLERQWISDFENSALGRSFGKKTLVWWT